MTFSCKRGKSLSLHFLHSRHNFTALVQVQTPCLLIFKWHMPSTAMYHLEKDVSNLLVVCGSVWRAYIHGQPEQMFDHIQVPVFPLPNSLWSRFLCVFNLISSTQICICVCNFQTHAFLYTCTHCPLRPTNPFENGKPFSLCCFPSYTCGSTHFLKIFYLRIRLKIGNVQISDHKLWFIPHLSRGSIIWINAFQKCWGKKCTDYL